jgi:hypothetical protein
MAKFNWRRVQIENRDRRSRIAAPVSTWESDLNRNLVASEPQPGYSHRRKSNPVRVWLTYLRRQNSQVAPIGRRQIGKRRRLRPSRNWRTFLTLQEGTQTRLRGVTQ